MGQVGQTEVGPNCLGDVDDRVGVVVPRRKDADFGFALGIDRALKESDPGMPSTRMGEHEQLALGATLHRPRPQFELREGRLDLRRAQPRGRADFVHREVVVDNHVLQPTPQLRLGSRFARLARVGGHACGRGEEDQHSCGKHAAEHPESARARQPHPRCQNGFGCVGSAAMPDIVLTTFNAKYIHAAFGLRYLMANLGGLANRAEIREFDIGQKPSDIAEALLQGGPRVIGIGVYIWNATLSLEVATILKAISPETLLVLGGPEVSYDYQSQPIVALADYLIPGEADLEFPELCRAILAGERPEKRVRTAGLPDLAKVQLPYALYDARDVANRIIYVEASRGCPFTCEFCLSSLDIPVRQFPLEPFLAALDDLLARGVRHFKFVDRTFNLNLHTSQAILDFFLGRLRPDLFLHFEMVPDRLPEQLRATLKRFPPGMVQLEVGIQTFDPAVSAAIKRRQNVPRLEENIRFLRAETGAHIHADLIVGLPGETMETFADGFDRLVALNPQEIQVGILKRLKGTPIVRHDATHGMIYSQFPPFELLRNRELTFDQMQAMRRFARHWDLVANSGNFVETTPLLWEGGLSPFHGFMEWSGHLYAMLSRNHAIALASLAEALFQFLTEKRRLDPARVAEVLWRDYQRGGRSDKPAFLRPFIEEQAPSPRAAAKSSAKRQNRWLAGTALAIALLAPLPATRAAEPPPSQPSISKLEDGTLRIGQARLDPIARTLRFTAIVNMVEGPIEYLLAHETGKLHESLFKTEVEPASIHLAALLLSPPTNQVGEAKPPKVRGKVSWTTKEGTPRSHRAEELVWDIARSAPMEEGPWLYVGSRLVEGVFLAQRDGSIVSIRSDIDALLDNPRPGAVDDENWRPNEKLVPPVGTQVQIELIWEASPASASKAPPKK